MKEFVEKLIEKIKVTSLEIIVTGTKDKPYFEIKYKEVGKEDYNIGYSSYDLNNVLNWKEECFEIVNQLAEEYKDKVIIDGQYCWQTCGANEHCKECNRLSNGSIDYYENYDCLAEEYNNGWISVSDRLPENPCWTITCDEEENIHIFFYRNGYFCESCGGKPITEQNARYYVPIAWQPLPAPFKKGE